MAFKAGRKVDTIENSVDCRDVFELVSLDRTAQSMSLTIPASSRASFPMETEHSPLRPASVTAWSVTNRGFISHAFERQLSLGAAPAAEGTCHDAIHTLLGPTPATNALNVTSVAMASYLDPLQPIESSIPSVLQHPKLDAARTVPSSPLLNRSCSQLQIQKSYPHYDSRVDPLQYTLNKMGLATARHIDYASNSIQETLLLAKVLGCTTVLLGVLAMMYLLVSGNAALTHNFINYSGLWLSVIVLILTFVAMVMLHWRNLGLIIRQYRQAQPTTMISDSTVAVMPMNAESESSSTMLNAFPFLRRRTSTVSGALPDPRLLVAGHVDYGMLRDQLQQRMNRTEQVLIRLPGCDEMLDRLSSQCRSSRVSKNDVHSESTMAVSDLSLLVVGERTL
ncbi:hypothetical protein MT418_000500 [Batrachochytrium dendrobatidis]